jgi:uncharacterized phage-associated protein
MTMENIEQTSEPRSAVGGKPARADSVCKFICERGEWAVSNLQLQKLLYIAQMCYLGVRGERLADVGFEAWDYGPVVPQIYSRVRMFGSRPIKDVFFSALPFAEDSDRKQVLMDVCRDLLPLRPGQLVEITHWKDGAWAKTYVPGAKGYRIPDSAILDEYRARTAAGHFTAA